MRYVLRFFLFIVDGKLASSAPRTGRPGMGWYPGPKALLLLSPQSFVSSLSEWLPPPHPLFPLSLHLVFLVVLSLHPSMQALFLLLLPPSLHLSSSVLLVSIPCSPASLCLLVPLSFSPCHSKTAVSLCRRSGGPGAEEAGGRGQGILSHPITPHSAESLGLWGRGGWGHPAKRKKEKKRTPKEGFLLLLFVFEEEIPEM